MALSCCDVKAGTAQVFVFHVACAHFALVFQNLSQDLFEFDGVGGLCFIDWHEMVVADIKRCAVLMTTVF
jgi:hypothetical protein